MSEAEATIKAIVIIFGLTLAIAGAGLYLWIRHPVWGLLGVGGVSVFLLGLTLFRNP